MFCSKNSFTNQLRVLLRVDYLGIRYFNVEVLVHRYQGSSHGYIILQLHSNLLAHQSLEEGEKNLCIEERGGYSFIIYQSIVYKLYNCAVPAEQCIPPDLKTTQQERRLD